jgi:chromosome partitioning protein
MSQFPSFQTWKSLSTNNPQILPESMRELPILVVDTDPQANTTEALGIDPVEVSMNIVEIYADPGIIQTTSGASLILATQRQENIMVVPSSIRLESISSTLPALIDGRTRLKDALDKIKSKYSLVLIDTPPSLGIFTQNAVVASDHILVPLTLSKHALLGVTNIISFLSSAKKSQNQRLNVLGLLVNAYDKRYRLQTTLLEAVRNDYNSFAFNTIIQTSSRIVENIAGRRNVLRNIQSDHREMLISLVKEVLYRMSNHQEFPIKR